MLSQNHSRSLVTPTATSLATPSTATAPRQLRTRITNELDDQLVYSLHTSATLRSRIYRAHRAGQLTRVVRGCYFIGDEWSELPTWQRECISDYAILTTTSLVGTAYAVLILLGTWVYRPDLYRRWESELCAHGPGVSSHGVALHQPALPHHRRTEVYTPKGVVRRLQALVNEIRWPPSREHSWRIVNHPPTYIGQARCVSPIQALIDVYHAYGGAAAIVSATSLGQAGTDLTSIDLDQMLITDERKTQFQALLDMVELQVESPAEALLLYQTRIDGRLVLKPQVQVTCVNGHRYRADFEIVDYPQAPVTSHHGRAGNSELEEDGRMRGPHSPRRRYIVEVDGMAKYGTQARDQQWNLHREKQRQDDLINSNIHIIRVTAKQVFNGQALNAIMKVLAYQGSWN